MSDCQLLTVSNAVQVSAGLPTQQEKTQPPQWAIPNPTRETLPPAKQLQICPNTCLLSQATLGRRNDYFSSVT